MEEMRQVYSNRKKVFSKQRLNWRSYGNKKWNKIDCNFKNNPKKLPFDNNLIWSITLWLQRHANGYDRTMMDEANDIIRMLIIITVITVIIKEC